MAHRSPAPRSSWTRLVTLVGGWLLVVVGVVLIPLPGPGWLVVGIGLLVLSRELRWARGAVIRVERFMRRHGMRTSLRRLIARSRRERARPAARLPLPRSLSVHAHRPGVVQWPLWAGFLAFVAAMLALDLGVFHRKAHAVSLREAATWSAVWIGLAGLFAGGVFWFAGPTLGMEFTTGYLIEKALSVDNIFVMVILFAAFGVPDHQQHRVLFWGILGALVMRAIFIFAGTALIARFHWTIYVFGAFLVITGIRMLRARRRAGATRRTTPLIRLARRVLPVAPGRTAGALLRPRRRKADGDPAVPGPGGGGNRPT